MQDTKKVAGELLVELEKKGVTFETVDGKLKYKDSKGNFTENSKEKVKKYKEEIIEILKKKQTIDEFITDNDYETNVYPLTDVQAAYLVGKTEAVKWGGIGCKGYIEVDFGSYSAEELSRAWKVLVNRHEMLRAKVTEVGFEILERDEIDYEIKIVNLQKMAEREKVDTLSKIREDFGEYVFHTEEGRLRYETYITDIKQVGMDQWTWRLTYKVFCGKNIVSTVDSLMSWNYQSVEKILNQLTKMHFRTAKLSETLLLAIKAR